MLSDVCFDFEQAIKKRRPVAWAAKDLLKGVEWYGGPDWDYPPIHIEALRRYAKVVIAEPENKQHAAMLRTLASAIRIMHDMVPEAMLR